MGLKTFLHELKTKISPSRLFKATVTEASDVLPKACGQSIKSFEVVGGGPIVPGCFLQTHFTDAAHFKSAKTKVEHIDPANYTLKTTLLEGDLIGDKVEKVTYEVKFEATEDGGCVVKFKSGFHTKGDSEYTDEEVNGYKEQMFAMFKGCEEYLLANPHACA